ncbi:MAG: thermonuclease family protein [Hyphomicrobiales bacterium]
MNKLAVVFVALTVLTGQTRPDFSRPDMITGPAEIIDGDTLKVGDVKIFLFGIDAPELDQQCRIFGLDWPCGERSRVWLARYIGGKPVRCLPEPAPEDYRGPGLKAICFNFRTINMNAAMVGEGMAIPNLAESDRYRAARTSARIQLRGFWAGETIEPALWRQGKRFTTRAKSLRRNRLRP